MSIREGELDLSTVPDRFGKPESCVMKTHNSVNRTQRSLGRSVSRVRPRRSPSRGRTVVIVGAGFSGTALAMHLLRIPHRRPLRVVLLERAPGTGGLAYGAPEKSCQLNAPAAGMSASSADPLEFLSYAQRVLPQARGSDFLPRELYGRYLESSLLSAARASPAHVRLERVHGEAIALKTASSTLEVYLENGGRIKAHTVVLAIGNPPPAPLPGSEMVRDGRYVADPWRTPVAFGAGETVLVAGTGLTMADIVLNGVAAGGGGHATIHAISRHGLMPAPQADFQQVHGESHGAGLMRAASASIRHLVREVRALAADVARRGGDWREAIAIVRAVAPMLWQRLATAERKRFLRHVQSYWDVHRHRVPGRTWCALDELRSKGQLHVHAGRILGLECVGGQVRVTWRARGASTAATILVERVVNCTGPQYNIRHTRAPLLRSLIAQGRAVSDPLGLGIATDEYGALVDVTGRAAANLYYVGPMLRPRYWETTAVPELRTHAEKLAQHLAVATGSRAPLECAPALKDFVRTIK